MWLLDLVRQWKKFTFEDVGFAYESHANEKWTLEMDGYWVSLVGLGCLKKEDVREGAIYHYVCLFANKFLLLFSFYLAICT